jgi:hypothetical protein
MPKCHIYDRGSVYNSTDDSRNQGNKSGAEFGFNLLVSKGHGGISIIGGINIPFEALADNRVVYVCLTSSKRLDGCTADGKVALGKVTKESMYLSTVVGEGYSVDIVGLLC